MNGEYWAGWFDHWGEKHHTTDAKKQADELDWILSQGYSISIYMVHGGTSFGWMNGANSNGKNYEPDVTSYDYDCAVRRERTAGRKVRPYFAMRLPRIPASRRRRFRLVDPADGDAPG